MPPITQPVHSENVTPKFRFQQSGTKLSNHRGLIEREEFKIAIDTALLQYQTELSLKCTDANQAMKTGLCILGANEFVAVLRKLADKDEAPTVAKPSDNLRS